MASTVKGLDSLLKKLTALAGSNTSIVDTAVMQGLGQAGGKVEEDAKKLCQPGKKEWGGTGRLRASISHQTTIVPNGYMEEIGTNVYYAVYVEFGTGPKGAASPIDRPPELGIEYTMVPWVFLLQDEQHNPILDKNGKKQFFRTSGQPARPFLYPAFKNNKNNMILIIAQRLKKAISALQKKG